MMSRYLKTSQKRTIRPAVLASLRGMAVFLLFTYQAWANICCGGISADSQLSCHSDVTTQASDMEESAESGHCHVTKVKTSNPPRTNLATNRITKRPAETLWCCQSAQVAEPPLPIPSSNGQVLLSTISVFSALSEVVLSVPFLILPVPPKSRPIFLTVSCLLI